MPKTRPASSVLESAVEAIGKGFHTPDQLRESVRTSPDSNRADKSTVAQRSETQRSEAQRSEAQPGAVASSSTQPITVIIPASSEYVLVVRLAVTGVASRMAFSYDQVEDIKLAVAEACNNAILHATPLHATSPGVLPLVTVQMMPYADRLEIRVFDEGRVPPPGLPIPQSRSSTSQSTSADETANELPESGLGLLIIQAMMDEVSHHTSAVDRTEVRMTKRLSR